MVPGSFIDSRSFSIHIETGVPVQSGYSTKVENASAQIPQGADQPRYTQLEFPITEHLEMDLSIASAVKGTNGGESGRPSGAEYLELIDAPAVLWRQPDAVDPEHRENRYAFVFDSLLASARHPIEKPFLDEMLFQRTSPSSPPGPDSRGLLLAGLLHRQPTLI